MDKKLLGVYMQVLDDTVINQSYQKLKLPHMLSISYVTTWQCAW